MEGTGRGLRGTVGYRRGGTAELGRVGSGVGGEEAKRGTRGIGKTRQSRRSWATPEAGLGHWRGWDWKSEGPVWG